MSKHCQKRLASRGVDEPKAALNPIEKERAFFVKKPHQGIRPVSLSILIFVE